MGTKFLVSVDNPYNRPSTRPTNLIWPSDYGPRPDDISKVVCVCRNNYALKKTTGLEIQPYTEGGCYWDALLSRSRKLLERRPMKSPNVLMEGGSVPSCRACGYLLAAHGSVIFPADVGA